MISSTNAKCLYALEKLILIVIFLICSISLLQAQKAKIDSIRSILSLQKDDIKKGSLLHALTLGYDRVNQDSVEFFSKELIEHGQNTAYTKGVYQGYNGMGMSYYRKGELDSSEHYFQMAYEQALQLSDTVEASRLLGNIGAINIALGNYEPALLSFFARLEILKTTPSKSGSLDKMYNNIAMAYYRLDNIPLAVEYYHRSLSLKLKEGNMRGVMLTYESLTGLYAYIEMPDSVIYYGKKSIALAKEFNDLSIESGTLLNMGVMYNNMNQYDSAEICLNQSLKLAIEIGDGENKARNYTNLGTLNDHKGNYAKALTLHQKALSLYTELGFKNEIKEANYALAKNLKSLGRFEEAYEHLFKHTSLKDSLFTEQNAKVISEVRTKYETEKKEQQLILQNSQMDAQSAELSRQQIIRNVAMGGVGVLVLVVVLFYRNSRIKVKVNKEIALKNDQLSKSLVERESLLKEIHHRVKNNLQIIASLLYLQSDESEDRDVRRLLEEGQGRVRSMALIHQKLYENDDLKHIPFGDYLTELISEIQNSFGEQAKDIELKIVAKDIFFDVDTAVPLGLIINELSTNAFKYAYGKHIGGGNLKISIKKVENDQYQMVVSDNGTGIPNEILNAKQSGSLGLKLTRMLSDQLEGEYDFDNTNGTRFELKFAV